MKTPVADRCGCAMGAAFMVAALSAALAYYGWQVETTNLPLSSAAMRTAGATFLAACAGKMLGILRYRLSTAR
jgi:hypothetical protein